MNCLLLQPLLWSMMKLQHLLVSFKFESKGWVLVLNPHANDTIKYTVSLTEIEKGNKP